MKQGKNTPQRTLNKKMLERLIIIHNAIKAGMYPDLQKLRKLYCEQTGYSKVGEATIYRDINTLRTYFHAPLDFDKENGGYYYMDDNWDFALNSISTEDVFYLSAAKTLLSNFEGSPIYNSISDVINFITDTQYVRKSSMLDRIAVAPVPEVNVDKEIWKNLLEAFRNNYIVEFDYNGRWNTETTHRKVAPYQFLFDNGLCFIFGYSYEREAERIFSLSRIKNLMVTSEHFDLPENYEFSNRCGGGKFGIFISDNCEDFVIDLYNDAREIVKEQLFSDNQTVIEFEEEQKTRITFSSTQTLRIMEWILSQGANAIPVSPDWFVDDWKMNIKNVVNKIKTLNL